MKAHEANYEVLSPDGISISGETYSTIDDALDAFKRWELTFVKQGYYSSNNGRIELCDLEESCTLIELN